MNLMSKTSRMADKWAKDRAEQNESYWYTMYRLDGMSKAKAFKASREKVQQQRNA